MNDFWPEVPTKRGGELRQFADLRGGHLVKNKKVMVFLRRGFGTPMHIMNFSITLIVILIYWCQCPRYSFP